MPVAETNGRIDHGYFAGPRQTQVLQAIIADHDVGSRLHGFFCRKNAVAADDDDIRTLERVQHRLVAYQRGIRAPSTSCGAPAWVPDTRATRCPPDSFARIRRASRRPRVSCRCHRRSGCRRRRRNRHAMLRSMALRSEALSQPACGRPSRAARAATAAGRATRAAPRTTRASLLNCRRAQRTAHHVRAARVQPVSISGRLHHDDTIGLHRRQPVRDDESRALHELLSNPDLAFELGIECRRRLSSIRIGVSRSNARAIAMRCRCRRRAACRGRRRRCRVRWAAAP